MQVIKKSFEDVPREAAHGGTGARRLYASRGELGNDAFEALAYGFLPARSSFDWHHHADTDEMMLVLTGDGTVGDRDGEYEYTAGDFFIFPANVEHAIHNPTDTEHEYIFVRVRIGAQLANA
jgi:quercetin dioxygenase-like cupin family protein